MSARRLVAFGGFVLAGVILMVLASSMMGSRVDLDATRATNSPAPEASIPAPITRPSSRSVAEEPVRVSTHIIDFGQVSVSYPKQEKLYFLNQAGGKLRLVGKGMSAPFRADQTAFSLDPMVTHMLGITFDPSQPGTYEQHLTFVLADGERAGEEVRVTLRGKAVLSPAAAGVAVPKRPDEEIRAYQAKKRAEAIAKAQADLEAREQAGGEPGGLDADPNAVDEAGSTGQTRTVALDAPAAGADGAGGGPRTGPNGDSSSYNPGVFQTAVAAFGMGVNDGPDLNDIPAPIPERETVPDLPPVEEEEEEGGSDDGPGPGSQEGGDSDDPGDQPEDDGPRVGLFTLAGNSLVTVYSTTGRMQQQPFPLLLSEDGASFTMDGRMAFPLLSMAFGQVLTMEQWGPGFGSVSPGGDVQISLSLRINDPNGSFLDLPITLTTGMAIGFSAEGRTMTASGYPIRPGGDVRLVGIANIPLGMNSSLDKAPILLEILGRIQL